MYTYHTTEDATWFALLGQRCPFCEHDLVLFSHLSAYKCTCGFRISEYKYAEYSALLSNFQIASQGFSNGFCFIPYDAEPPF